MDTIKNMDTMKTKLSRLWMVQRLPWMHASKTAMDVCSKSAWTLTTAPHLVAKPALITSVCFFFSGEEEEGEEGI